jgi:hypothetical protein
VTADWSSEKRNTQLKRKEVGWGGGSDEIFFREQTRGFQDLN